MEMIIYLSIYILVNIVLIVSNIWKEEAPGSKSELNAYDRYAVAEQIKRSSVKKSGEPD